MAEVTQLKKGTWTVYWSLDVINHPRACTEFQCGRKPNFLLKCSSKESQLCAWLRVVETGLPTEYYPTTATAFVNGRAQVMNKLGNIYWAKFDYKMPDLCYGCYDTQDRNVHFTLTLEFPSLRETKQRMHIFNQYSKLLDDRTLSDVTFIVKGHEMAAHAAILNTASPVMATMLEAGKFQEGHNRTVLISDIEPEIFKKFLLYIYTGNVSKLTDESVAEQLLYAADKYQMESLKATCEGALLKKLNVNNAIRFLVLAHLHSTRLLKEASILCLVEHQEQLSSSSEWKDLNTSFEDLYLTVCHRIKLRERFSSRK